MIRYLFVLCRLARLGCSVVLFFLSVFAWSGHPTMDGEMAHPSQPLPEGALVPSVSFEIFPDMMDGYNLRIDTANFNAVPPLVGTEDTLVQSNGLLVQGHMHLYVNGKKMMRVYGSAAHLPSSWLRPGVNSITLSLNNHRHGTFTYQYQEIQSTIIIDGDADELVKNIYTWPASQPLRSERF